MDKAILEAYLSGALNGLRHGLPASEGGRRAVEEHVLSTALPDLSGPVFDLLRGAIFGEPVNTRGPGRASSTLITRIRADADSIRVKYTTPRGSFESVGAYVVKGDHRTASEKKAGEIAWIFLTEVNPDFGSLYFVLVNDLNYDVAQAFELVLKRGDDPEFQDVVRASARPETIGLVQKNAAAARVATRNARRASTQDTYVSTKSSPVEGRDVVGQPTAIPNELGLALAFLEPSIAAAWLASRHRP